VALLELLLKQCNDAGASVETSFELDIHLAPVLFFDGTRLFEQADAKHRRSSPKQLKHEAKNRTVRQYPPPPVGHGRLLGHMV
jgi:hypothetical protein